MTVRVGIVSYNTADLLDACLHALPAALDGLEATVVVVDNASSDDSAARARAHGVTVIENPTNVGYARAMNQALAGEDDVLIACNPDAAPPPGALATLVRSLLDDERCALVAPRLLHADGRLQHSVHRFPTPWTSVALAVLPGRVRRGELGRRLWLEGAADHEQRTTIDWAIGAVHVIRARALEGEPPYDERWFMYIEDLDLCWRLQQRGWTVVLDGTVAVPHVGNVAGAATWGARRTPRVLWATYDWVRLRQGPMRQRAYALANLVAHVGLVLRPAVATPFSGRARRLTRRRWTALRSTSPIHLRALVLGPTGQEAAWGPPIP